MSTIIMSQCWPLTGMSPAQKAVLISMADQANDDGYCWPSVGTISNRTCLSERAVQGAIKWLQSAGLLGTSERRGTSSVYQITPAAYAPPQMLRPADAAPTPAGNAPPPPQMLHPTPADAAPKPSMNRQLNHQEPKDTRAKTQAFVLPDWIPSDTWAAFMETRRAKKAKSTDYALGLIVKSLETFRAEGHNPVDILNKSIKSGWSDVYPPKVPASAVTPARRHEEPAWRTENRNRMAEFAPLAVARKPTSDDNVIDMETTHAQLR